MTRAGARLESSDIADSEEMRGDLCVPATQGGFRSPSAEEDSPWREVSHGKGTCARKSPESSELIRQEEIAENLLKPATFFHPAAVTDATSAPSIALRLR